MALVDFNCGVLKVSDQDIKTTQECFDIVGAEGNLMLHCDGSKMPLSETLCSKTLPYVARARRKLSEKLLLNVDAKNKGLIHS